MDELGDLWEGLLFDAHHHTDTANDKDRYPQRTMMLPCSANDVKEEPEQTQFAVKVEEGGHFKEEVEMAKKNHPQHHNQPLTESGIAPLAAAGPDRKKTRKSRERRPRFVFKTRSEKEVMEDGYKWRKYGKKTVKSSPHPRNYYRCLEKSCTVKKRIERDPSDESMVITTYEGTHNHECPCIVFYCVAQTEQA